MQNVKTPTKQIKFNPSDDRHKKAYNLLELSGKKQSEIMIIALNELIDSYQLENASAEEIKSFVDTYYFCKAKAEYDAKRNLTTFFSSFSQIGNINLNGLILTEQSEKKAADLTSTNTVEEKKELVSADEKMKMANIMASAWK